MITRGNIGKQLMNSTKKSLNTERRKRRKELKTSEVKPKKKDK